jgi:TonB family protein
MTEEELQQPIHIERFHIIDHTGIYRHRVRVSIEVGLDEQGYVTYPRVTESNVSKGINEEIVSAVSQWRWCPQFSQRLEGGRFEIPFDIPMRNLGGPDI